MDPYLYVYGLGAIIFGVGLTLAAREGWVGLRGAPLRNLLLVVGVALFFAVLQGLQQYAPMETAPSVPYDGGADELMRVEGRTRGAAIDYVIVALYFVLILGVGTWVGRRQKSTKDFFFGGQRFAWWLIAFSLIATTVGSYSFVKYSNRGFAFGLSSSQSYLNDWVWLPLLIFGWLPILYFSRVASVPEYFGRRFGGSVRLTATVCILIYLVGYIGVNLFTMGKVLEALIGIPIPVAALITAGVSASYVTAGGQTSVIITDLMQGVVLLVAGGLILYLGFEALGGFDQFWHHLPRGHRAAFPNFNEDPGFSTVGIFWQDAVANSAMFYFLNQGIMMRFLAARSMPEARKAIIATVLVLMTIGAAVVGGGGWIAQALVHAGLLPPDLEATDAFYVATELISRPGVFGLILAALTAALMSTVDTLITAVAAIVVNDVYRPYVRPAATERQLLSVARISSLAVTGVGVLLVPLFMQFDSIYTAHGAFTAAVTPPLVVAFLLSVFWKRFTARAALWTMIGGMAAVALSLFVPEVITPFAHGVPMAEVEPGFLSGMKQYTFMRALYGLSVSTAIGLVATAMTRAEPASRLEGLVWGHARAGIEQFRERAARGAPPSCEARATAVPRDELPAEGDVPGVRISRAVADAIGVSVGDQIYINDTRSWLGGLHSTHARIAFIDDEAGAPRIELDEVTFGTVVTRRRKGHPVRVERS